MAESKRSDSLRFYQKDRMVSIRETLWTKRTVVEKRLIVSVALLAVASLVLLVVLLCNLGKAAPRVEAVVATLPTTEVCNTTICKRQAAVILSAMDQSLDPCNDFYEFTCQNWERNNHIPEDETQYGTFQKLTTELLEDLKGILEKTPYKTSHQNISDKVVMMYYSCINDTPSDEAQVWMFKDLLVSVNISGWPLHKNPASNDVLDYEFFSKLYTMTGTNSIFTVSPTKDPENVTNHVLIIAQPTFGLERHQLVRATAPENRAAVEAYKTFIGESIKFLANQTKQDELKTIVDAIFDFEVQLANRTRSPTDPPDASGLYKKSLAQLQADAPGIDWIRFLDTIFRTVNITLDDQQIVIVTDLRYVNSTIELLKTVDKKTVYNYMGWQMIQKRAPSTSQKFRDLNFYFRRVLSGVQKMNPLWQQCIETLNEIAPIPVAKLYVEHKFSAQEKADMESLVNDLREAFELLLKENYWMDAKTKEEAFKKLRMMIVKIGYPNWIMNNTYLNSHFAVPDFKPEDSFLKGVLTLVHSGVSQSLLKLRTFGNRSKEWIINPATVNAFYALNENAFYFPVGILQFPTYSYGLPVNINMGTIGFTIGHEITHGFDGQGSQRDENGNLRYWWTKETAAEFTKKAHCFVEQYGSKFDQQANMTLNGVLTQNENIADNGGIREAFRAQRIAIAKSGSLTAPALPGLEKYTSDQMFFIALGVQWCTLTRTEALKEAIRTDPHSPAKYRINIPMQNFDQFAKTFHCPEGSPMNPEDRCVLW